MSIINKLKNFIQTIFNRPKTLNEGKNIETTKTDYMNALQKDTKSHFYKKQILEEIETNPSIIDTLSYERLVQLNSLYDEAIEELQNKLNSITKNKNQFT